MPVIMLGGEYGALFWSGSWYYVTAFLCIIGVIDAYFIRNWSMFTLLEGERWKELETYLGSRVKPGKVPSRFIVKIMINAYVMNGNLAAVEELGKVVREKKPALFRKLLLSFSIPILLESDPEKMENFFKPYITDVKLKERNWIRYLYAFSLLLQKKRKEAVPPLTELCSGNVPPVLLLLTVYSLSAASERSEDRECISGASLRLKNRYTKESFTLEIEKERSHVIAAVLAKLIDDALRWLYDGTEPITNKET